MRKSTIRKYILIPFYATIAIFALLLIFAAVRFYRSQNELKQIQAKVHTKVMYNQVDEGEILPKYESLYEKNSDMVGWLKIPGADVDYPVMYKAGDNDYYLGRNFFDEPDVNGLLVLDKRCNSTLKGSNNLIHGHNMNSGKMFGSLKKYLDKETFAANPYIYLDSLYEEHIYQIFAVFKSSVYDENTSDLQYYDFLDLEDEDEFNEYCIKAISQSVYDTGVRPVYGDRILTLSTCDRSKKNGRLVVVAMEIK